MARSLDHAASRASRMSEPSRSSSTSVQAWLSERGVEATVVDAARARDQLHLLVAANLAMPDTTTISRDEILARTGFTDDELASLWRSLGFPANGERAAETMRATDLDALTTIANVRHSTGLTQHQTDALARVISATTSRVAEAGLSSFAVANRDTDPAARAEHLLETAAETFPAVAKLLDFAWRRHLHGAAERLLALDTPVDLTEMADLTVGFADMAGFTSYSHQLSPAALSELLDRFASIAQAAAHDHGGRIVKVLGDEVMFVTDRPDAAVAVGLDLVARADADGILSAVKVGIAHGPALARDGDLFGPVVNTASRITGITRPGAVVTTDEVRQAATTGPEITWRNLRRCYLRDIGWVRLWGATCQSAAPRNPAVRLVSVLDDRLRESLEQIAALRGRVG